MRYTVDLVLFAWLGAEVRALLVWPLYLQPLPLTSSSTQYQAQDILGQFTFGYTGNNQFRVESQSLDGSVQGSYGYVDPSNKAVQVMYEAGAGGFRVLGGNNLPTVPANPSTPPLPQAVDYTPEVAAARAEFEKTYNELAAKSTEVSDDEHSKSSRRKRSILLPALYAFPPAPTLKVRKTEQEELKDVISPADTEAVEFKEVEESVPLPTVLVTPTIKYAPPPTYGYWLH